VPALGVQGEVTRFYLYLTNSWYFKFTCFSPTGISTGSSCVLFSVLVEQREQNILKPREGS